MTEPILVDQVIHAFESAWLRGDRPDIGASLPGALPAANRRALLIELVCIDIEMRWKSAAPIKELEEYVREFGAELGSLAELPIDVIAEEYRARTKYGGGAEDVVGRFPERSKELTQAFSIVDRELLTERLSSEPTPSSLPRPGTDNLPPAPLAYDDFVLQKLIGAGRMGRVYRAWRKSTQTELAVKFLRKRFLSDAEAVSRFRREALIVSEIQHPNLVEIEGLGGTPGGGFFIAMELANGDLASRLQLDGPLAPAQAASVTQQIALALTRVHAAGVVHCDLKPANVLLRSDGEVCLTDFGLARRLGEWDDSTERIEGTVSYMAPEQVSRWWGPVNERTDVYGLGCVLYEALTGRPPFQGETVPDVLAQVVSGVLPTPVDVGVPVPASLAAVCMKCLQKRPGDRFATVAELRRGLGV